MHEVTQILTAIDAGDTHAIEQLLPIVYQELRDLAAIHMSKENPGHTLNATALVHEVYLKLVKPGQGNMPTFANRKHFFLAASDSMRKILIDHARIKGRQKRGGGLKRKPLFDLAQTLTNPDELLMIDEVLDKFAESWPRRAELLKLRIFAGCTINECAELLGISPSTAEDNWTYARAWIRREWQRGEGQQETEKE
jgi:RNA polymerase sigma factor (TIGR02999 family)